MSLQNLSRVYHKIFTRASTTRGHGVLERLLSILRARCAKRLIEKYCKTGRRDCLIDIGCGMYPIFLLTAPYRHKHGLDKVKPHAAHVRRRFQLINFDIERDDRIPLSDGQADVVSLLAVFEHLNDARLPVLFAEIRRVLKPSGICVLTTPSTWSDGLLKFLAKIRLVSSHEIDDHKINFSTGEILKVLKSAGFSTVQNGYFECFLNRWFVLSK